MNLFGLDISLAKKSSGTISIDQLIRRLEAIHDTVSGINVTPDTALQSPTVLAIDTAITRRLATLPIHVMRKVESNGRTTKERIPDHPVAKLLRRPNPNQTRTSYWLDATSWLVRYNRFYAFKARGLTGPIRRLEPLPPSTVEVEQNDDLSLRFRVHQSSGGQRDYTRGDIHHARGRSVSGIDGDSPVLQAREAIALEIAAEKFGASFFGNGAMPLLIFNYLATFQGHKTEDEREQFIQDFQNAYQRGKRFRAMIMPKGMEVGDPIPVENDKAQMIETRRYQRTVIAGAFGVPPYHVGDLEKGTFNNVEQQSLSFVMNCVMPYAKIFEDAMELDLLTDADRNGGVIIRFNLDAGLRGDFKSRQDGLNIQRQNGVINANDWREHENMNPISKKDGGEEFWRQGPSGQSAKPGKTDPAADQNPDPNADPDEDPDKSEDDKP